MQNSDIHRWDGPPFPVKGSNTEFSLTIQWNVFNILYYVLKFNEIYEVEVSMLVTISVIDLSVCLSIHLSISICLLIHSILMIFWMVCIVIIIVIIVIIITFVVDVVIVMLIFKI